MIIDTNIYSGIVRNDPVVYARFQQAYEITVPLAVVAELEQGFLGGDRYDDNMQRLRDFLAQDIVHVHTPTLLTATRYAKLSDYARRHGRALSHNDLWIAATALECGEPLLTADKDFAIFAEYPELEVQII